MLAHAAEMVIRHAQSDFPVLAGGRVVGLLTRHDLTRALSADGADRTAGNVMQRTFETVDWSEPLDAVFGRLSQEPGKTLLATDHGPLVGLVGLDEITNLLRLRRVIAERHAHVASAELKTAWRTGTDR